MGTMFTSPQDHSVYRIFIHFKQTRGGSDSNAFSCVMNNLSDGLDRQMQPKQRTSLGRSKSFAASAAVKQIAVFVFAILAANRNITLTA
jgi:hypothetical protein